MAEVKNVDFARMKRSFVFDIKLDRRFHEDSENIYINKFEVRGDLKAFLDILEIGSMLMKLNLQLIDRVGVNNVEYSNNPEVQENLNLLLKHFERAEA